MEGENILTSQLYNIQETYVFEQTSIDKNLPRCVIDINNRNINVPIEIDSLGVQYDHRSNALIFEIDRYIDDVDLLTQSCIIQWINSGRDGENSGLYPVVMVDSSIEGKLLFCWEIFNESTQFPGNIFFAVRFYSMQDEDTFIWSYNTLPAQSIIEDTLDVVLRASIDIEPSMLELWNARMTELAKVADSSLSTSTYNAKEAEAWAHGRSDYPSSIIDNAKYYKDMTAAIYDEAKGTIDGEKDNVIIAINDVRDQGIVQISEAKNQALQDISDVKDGAISEIEIAKNELLNSVPNYEESIDELENQLNVISESVAELDNKLGNVADGIVNETSGNSLVVNDSSESRLRGLRVFGKTEQQTYSGKNLFNPENVIQGYFTISNKTFLAAAAETTSIWCECEPNTTYTVSKTLGARFYIGYTTEVPALGVSVTYIANTESQTSLSYTSGDEVTYLVAYVHHTTHDTISLEDMLASVQIEKGSVATAYEPYTGGIPSPNPQYPQELVSAGDDGDVEVGVYGGNLCDNVWEQGSINLDKGKNFKADVEIRSANYIPVVYKEKLYIKRTIIGGYLKLRLYDKNYEYLGGGSAEFYEVLEGSHASNPMYTNDNRCVIKITNEKVAYIRIIDTTNNLSTKYFVGLYDGDRNEPYHKQTLTALTPNGLPGIKVTDASLANYTDSDGNMWCSDEVDFERGVYVKRVKKCDVTGSTITWYVVNEYFCELKPDDLLNKDGRSPVMSNCFRYSQSTKVEGDAFAYKSTIRLYKTFADLSEARTWFDNNDVNVMYILATPIETPLSEEELTAYRTLHSNYPVTTVLNDSGANMEVKYNADTKNYIDNKFAEMTNAILSMGGNV